MAVLNLDYLKTLFETYDKPTEQDFADLIDTLSTTIAIIPNTILGTGNVWTDLNNSYTLKHDQKQLDIIYHNGVTYLFDAPLGTYGASGIATSQSNYINIAESQFTEEQVEAILDLLYGTVTISSTLDVSEFEKGVATSILYNSLIEHKGITVLSITLNNVNQQIGANETTVNSTDSITVTKDYILKVTYLKSGNTTIQTDTITSNGYVPKLYGLSLGLDYDGNPVSAIPLSKYIGASNTIEYSGVLNSMNMWFIVPNASNEIFDQNGLFFKIGDWTSDDFFIHKSGFIVLNDGTNEPVQFYRSLTTLESKGQNYKFKIDDV